MSDDLQQRVYPEDERLRQVQADPDRRMTRDEWEREESAARQAAHKRHDSVKHDREVQQEADRKKKSQHRNWGKILVWVCLGILVLFLIYILGYLPHRAHAKKAAAASKQREDEQPQVQVITVKRSGQPGELTVPGTTSPLTEAFIYARANGYLKKRYADIGDHVTKGQLLAIIDAPDLDQQVEQARQQLHQAEADVAQQQAQLDLKRVTWERWRTLVAKGVFSRQDGDQRETDYRAQLAIVASAQRNVQSFRANLNRAIALQSYERVTSPFDGIVTQRNADVGALVGAGGSAMAAPSNSSSAQGSGASSASTSSSMTSGTSGNANMSSTPNTGGSGGGAIFAIAQVDTLRILVPVPEGYASSIVVGMPAKVFLQERTGKPIDGTVTRATRSLDQNTRTMLTEVDLDNRNGSLIPGMYTVVTFVQVRGQSPLTVPGDAVVVRQDRTTVAIVRDMKVQMVPVEIGRDYGPSVEIVGGLHEGDHVITTVTDGVRQGVKVRPVESSEASEGKSGAQSNAVASAGPNQYGDQSIVNQKSESTNNQGKKGSGAAAGGKSGGQQQQSGKQDKSQKEDKDSK